MNFTSAVEWTLILFNFYKFQIHSYEKFPIQTTKKIIKMHNITHTRLLISLYITFGMIRQCLIKRENIFNSACSFPFNKYLQETTPSVQSECIIFYGRSLPITNWRVCANGNYSGSGWHSQNAITIKIQRFSHRYNVQ